MRKKFIACLSLIFILCFVSACGSSQENSLIGSWTGEVELDKLELSEEDLSSLGTNTAQYTLTLNDDSTFSMTLEANTQAGDVKAVENGTYVIDDQEINIVLTNLQYYVNGEVVSEETEQNIEQTIAYSVDEDILTVDLGNSYRVKLTKQS